MLTDEQLRAIEGFLANERIAVEAVAGSGKTTLLLQMAEKCNKRKLIIAFNKSVQEDHQARLGTHTVCKTFNGLGHGILMGAFRPKLKIDFKKTDTIMKKIKVRESLEEVFRLNYDRARTEGVQNVDKEMSDVDEEIRTLVKRALVEDISMAKNFGAIDFDDQNYLPVVLPVRFPRFEVIFVDEFQDLSLTQVKFVLQLVQKDTQVVIAGDPNQAIYGFRGVDMKAMEHLQDGLGLKRYPLTTCFRCSQEVVKKARHIVPNMNWMKGAPEGKVQEIDFEEAEFLSGDVILARKNSSLIRIGLEFLIKGKPFIIDKLLTRIFDRGIYKSKGNFANLLAYVKSLEAIDVEQINDLAKCWRLLIKDCISLKGVRAKRDRMADSYNHGVRLSSVHQAKGREWKRVFYVGGANPKLKTIEEQNIHYVAVTRAKLELFLMELKKST